MVAAGKSSLKKEKKERSLYFVRNLTYTLMNLPGLILTIVFSVLPLFGLLLAFKNFNYVDGIFGSPWCGLDQFKNLFYSDDLYRCLRNTVLYNAAKVITLNIIMGIVVALLLYEVRNKIAFKIYQTTMLLPSFMSWAIISYIVFALLSYDDGLINQLLRFIGITPVLWYDTPIAWPFIITLVLLWKESGMSSIYYYSCLLSIDPCLFEAAAIDGAGKFKQIWHVSIPVLKPMLAMCLITQVGNILTSGWDHIYSLTLNSPALRSTTDNFGMYMLRMLKSGTDSFGRGTAMGILNSLVCMLLVRGINQIVKKYDSNLAMF